MGDRALIIFTDGAEVSPTVYLHWNGSSVPKLLEVCHSRMMGRLADVEYGVARFIGICHEHIDGNLSLGCWNTDEAVETAARKVFSESEGKHIAVLAEHSHGDAGVVVVNVNDYSWKAFGGYLAKAEVAA
jgi:hypothetical protein